MYNKKVLFYYNDNSNVGFFSKYFIYIGVGLIGSLLCGDIIKLQFLILRNSFIYDIKFKTYGCGSAIAVSSFVSNYLKYKFLFQVLFLKNFFISNELNLPCIKFHCSVLIENVVKLTVFNYKNNFIIFFYCLL